jgi:hypothetical protein
VSVTVYTWREGLLARVGHDLRISASTFTFREEEGRWTLRVPVHALRVDGAMKDGRLVPVGDGDRRDIEAAMHEEVLRARQFPEVVATVVGDAVELRLMGRTLRLSVDARRADGRVRATVELVPSRWGIPPYKALLGALRLQDRVRVDVDLPMPG